MIKDIVSSLRKSEGFLHSYNTALSNLYGNQVIELLRELGRAKTIPSNVHNYVDCQAAQANWSIGYNDCLDDLLYLIDRYIYPKTASPDSQTKPDFGAIATLLAAGDITEAEADILRKQIKS